MKKMREGNIIEIFFSKSSQNKFGGMFIMKKEIRRVKRLIGILNYVCLVLGFMLPVVAFIDWCIYGYERHPIFTIYTIFVIFIVAICQYLISLFKAILRDIRFLSHN